MKEHETRRFKATIFFFSVAVAAGLILTPLSYFDGEICRNVDNEYFSGLKIPERDKLTLGNRITGMTGSGNRMYEVVRKGKLQGFVRFARIETLTSDLTLALLYSKEGTPVSSSILGVSGPGHQWLNDFRLDAIGKWLSNGALSRSTPNGQTDAVSGATELCGKITALILNGQQFIISGGI